MNARDEIIIALSDIDPKHLRCVTPLLRPRPAVTWREIMKRSVKWTGKLIGAAAAAVIVLGLIILPGLWQDNTPIQAASPTEEEPLRICIDTGFYGSEVGFAKVKSGADALKNSLASICGLENVETEIIPKRGEAREAALQRIRTEVMGGGGPDVFLCSCVEATGSGATQTALFPFPANAMANGLFLPLDSYLENAQYMEVDKMHPAIMEGGKTEEGQMVVPISFTMPITAYEEGAIELPPSMTTFADVVNSDDPLLQATGAYVGKYDDYLRCYFSYVFAELEDYETGKLAVTEDELREAVKDAAKLKQANQDAEELDLPAHFSEQLSFDTYSRRYVVTAWQDDWRQGIYDSVPQVILPLYNQKGGATALINSFAAVNANTTQPENAFAVVDLILSKYMCKNNELYAFFCETAMPVHMEMGEYRDVTQESYGLNVPYSVKGKTSIESPAFSAYAKAREQISCTRFCTKLDHELINLVTSCSFAIKEGDEALLESNISEAYKKMETLLSES